LRYRLFQLAASGLLPLALVATLGVGWLVHERRQETQRSALEVARALATAVDAELRATISVLQSLGESDDLRPDRLRDFQALARRVAEHQGWRSVVVADRSGRILMSSALELGAASPRPVDAKTMDEALRTRKPVVGRVAEGPFQRGPAFAVRVPVVRNDQMVYVLSAVIPAERVLAVVTRHNVPATWTVAVFDQAGTRVARSRDHALQRPSPSMQAILDSGDPEGMGTARTLEGVETHGGYSRLRDSGWIVAVGISATEANKAIYPVLGAVVLGLLASLALSAFLARYFARRVSEPIDALKTAAAALGSSGRVALAPLGVAELDQVGQALTQASAERDRAAHERRANEAEREALLARVTEALRMAQEAGRSKDEFLAMLGHELRNPLAPIATALHLMARKGDERTRAESEVVERQLAHMTRLVDDLLDVSRITGKRLAMHFAPVRLGLVLQRAAEAARPMLGTRSLRLQFDPVTDQTWLSADEVRLAQVLNNLLGNAIKFTAPDGHIVLRARLDAGTAEVEVADDGLGMPPQVMEQVFDAFYQAPQGTDRAMGGLGLGLAIVRSLVEMHGGTVRAESEGPGQGSRFIVRLPTIAPPDLAPAPAPTAAVREGVGKVLVVDDNQDAADTAAALLEMSGYDVRTAYEPQAALRTFDTFGPDVAVLDIGLPGMSGYDLAAELRGHARGRHCRLVALTGYGTQGDVERAMTAGFNAHLAKPAEPRQLLETVERLMASET
jgi:signal transduction histidine kinase/ActR/RegA family two-component response regulator